MKQLALLAMLFCAPAFAATNLPAICAGAAVGIKVAACPSWSFDIATEASLVRVCKKSTPCAWNDDEFQLARFGALGDLSQVEVCGQLIDAGPLLSCPLNAVTWGGMKFIPKPMVAQAPPTKPGTGVMDVSWGAVSSDTGGKPITVVAYRVYWSCGSPLLTQTVDVTALLLTYKLTQLPAGQCFAAVTALSATAESDRSNVAIKNIEAQAEPKPQAPVVTVAANRAFGISLTDNDHITATAIGTVPAGTKCLSTQTVLDMFLVPRTSVLLDPGVKTRPRAIAAKCS